MKLVYEKQLIFYFIFEIDLLYTNNFNYFNYK